MGQRMGKKTKSLGEKSDQELVKLLAEKRRKLVDYQMEKSTLKLKKVQIISQVRREIARILTLLRAREIRASLEGGSKNESS